MRVEEAVVGVWRRSAVVSVVVDVVVVVVVVVVVGARRRRRGDGAARAEERHLAAQRAAKGERVAARAVVRAGAVELLRADVERARLGLAPRQRRRRQVRRRGQLFAVLPRRPQPRDDGEPDVGDCLEGREAADAECQQRQEFARESGRLERLLAVDERLRPVHVREDLVQKRLLARL